MSTAPLLSVVMPIYNEQEALPLTVERLRPILDGLGITRGEEADRA